MTVHRPINALADVCATAHITLHPNSLKWPCSPTIEEFAFLRRMLFDDDGGFDEAAKQQSVAYLSKELCQLAELERHVSGVLTLVLSQMQDFRHEPVLDDGLLQRALSSFAAEELHHAAMFERYVHWLSRKSSGLPGNRYLERLGVFLGPEHPLVKLAALCSTAYVGETVITVFEHRANALDPEQRFFLTQLLHAHGLDEARHVKVDEAVFEYIVPDFDAEQRVDMKRLVTRCEGLNRKLAERSKEHAAEMFGVDPAANHAYAVQAALTEVFHNCVVRDGHPVPVDKATTNSDRALLLEFSSRDYVHRAGSTR